MISLFNNLKDSLNNDHVAIFVMALVLLAYLLYWFGIKSSIFVSLSSRLPEIKNSNFISVVMGRFYGMMILGILPLLFLIGFTDYSIYQLGLGIQSKSLSTMLLWIFLLSIAIVGINYRRSGKESNLSMYPQIRMRSWTKRHVLLNLISWTCYLVGYEILFRGILLFPLYNSQGYLMAITINTMIYALVHLPKGAVETIGAIPLGILFCYITLETNSIYVSVIVHVVMASSNFLFSLKKHPKMNLITK